MATVAIHLEEIDKALTNIGTDHRGREEFTPEPPLLGSPLTLEVEKDRIQLRSIDAAWVPTGIEVFWLGFASHIAPIEIEALASGCEQVTNAVYETME